MREFRQLLRRCVRAIEALTGEDAYERYLAHHAHRHPGIVPLSRAAFWRAEPERRWSNVNRCC